MEMEGTWRRQVWSAARALAAYALLLTFTILVFLKLRHPVFFCSSWWVVFSPLWLFHVVVARGRISIPSPSDQDDCLWAPYHAVAATPLLVAFELLLCVYLESTYVSEVAAVNLKIVFIPVLILETSIIIDNLRVTSLTIALEQKEKSPIGYIPPDRRRGEDVQCHFISNGFTGFIIMPFILVGTVFIVPYLDVHIAHSQSNIAGDDHTDKKGIESCAVLFLSTGLCVTYLMLLSDVVCFPSCPWTRECRSPIKINLYKSWRGFLTLLLVPFVVLLVIIPDKDGGKAVLRESFFYPIFILEGIGVVFYTSQLVELGIFMTMMLNSRRQAGNYCAIFTSARAGDYLEFICHGSRFLSWWSIDQGITEIQARRLHDNNFDSGSGCNTFCGSHPDVVKKMTNEDLVQEVHTLQVAIKEQLNNLSKQLEEYQWERTFCKICFQKEIDVLLLPCRHRFICSTCGEKCSICPICRVSIAQRNAIEN